jgi:hypothetical protein
MKYWEIIGDNLSKAGRSWGCVSAVDSCGHTIWIPAHRDDGKRFLVHADDKLTRFWNSNPRFVLAANWLDRLARFFQNLVSLNGFESGGGNLPR